MSKHEHSNLFNRYIWLLQTIYSAGKITYKEINARWKNSVYNKEGEGLPMKTFQRHCNAIEAIFNIEIECEKGGAYRYYIENLDDVDRDGISSWLLGSLSVNNIVRESTQLKSRILLENIPSGQKFLSTIVEAMKVGVSLEMTYQSFSKGESSTFLVEPWCVKIFRQRWYMLGKSDQHPEPRIYALDRILEISQSGKPFSFPEDFDPQGFFADCFGIIVCDRESSSPEDLVIRVRGGQQKYIRSLPWHSSQKEIKTAEDYSDFSMRLYLTYDLRQEILSHGNDIEVLSPQWFRDDLARISSLMDGMYNGAGKGKK